MAFMSVRIRCFAASILLVIISYSTAAQESLRHSLFYHHKSTTQVECIYHQSDVQSQDGQSLQFDVCQVEGQFYSLPDNLLDPYRVELESGRTRIHIEPATLQSSEHVSQSNEILLTTSRVTVHNDFFAHRNIVQQQTAMGNLTVIAVRVTSNDAEVSLSREELSNSMGFGSSASNVTLASQLNACSAGALTLVPGIEGGVGELVIPVNTRGVPTKNLETLLRNEFVLTFGSEDDFDHILFCMPNGTSTQLNNWIAYAYRDTKFSYYNDVWCNSLTSRMHEMGHNWGLGHSGEGNEGNVGNYEDRTCSMGVSFPEPDGPQECYNGWRHWYLGWFRSRQVVVNPLVNGPWSGKLAAFVDYPDIGEEYFVILRVRDIFIQYNLADKHNRGVAEKPNNVTVVKSGGSAEQVSTMLVGLDMQNPIFAYRNRNAFIVIELCEEGTDENGVRFVRLIIREQSQTLTCSGDPPMV